MAYDMMDYFFHGMKINEIILKMSGHWLAHQFLRLAPVVKFINHSSSKNLYFIDYLISLTYMYNAELR